MIKPQDMLKLGMNLQKAIEIAESKEIAVGLPKSSPLTRVIYKKEGSKKKGKSVLEIGVIHEFGLGKNPLRSFLRVPFAKNKNRIESALEISFKKVANEGANPIRQLERTGAFILNIVLEAFNSKGFGTWKPLKASTVNKKKSSAILTDTATLKRSNTYVVRNATT
jgi:hypothetical protein